MCVSVFGIIRQETNLSPLLYLSHCIDTLSLAGSLCCNLSIRLGVSVLGCVQADMTSTTLSFGDTHALVHLPRGAGVIDIHFHPDSALRPWFVRSICQQCGLGFALLFVIIVGFYACSSSR